MARISFVFGVFLLTVCAQAQDAEHDEFLRRHSYYGKTLADVILGTGRTPTSSADLSPERRLFVFYGDTTVIGAQGNSFVPDVAVARTCKVTVETIRIGRTNTASDFRVIEINEDMACGLFF